ncbi:MAG: hypothetical protein HKM93_04980 [Desulfobacteraceae bacterium]|nr:hypothetical protein [Desulfobacteraceae bacterium]
MATEIDGIRVLDGTTDILVAAPHGPFANNDYQNDIRTGLIVERIQGLLGCTAVINDRFLKPTLDIPKSRKHYLLDMFKTGNAKKVAGYLERIRQVADTGGKTIVVWVHGIADKVAITQGREHAEAGLFDKSPDQLHALVGYGQGGDPKTGDQRDNHTAARQTVERFRDELTGSGMTTLLTRENGGNFRGRDVKRLNQWFLQQGFGFDQVESIQLEIKEQDFRDSDTNATEGARIIAGALKAVVDRC